MSDYVTIAALTGDRVIYRNLQPYESGLPGLREVGEQLCLPRNLLPRKRDAAYARVVLELLRAMQASRSSERLDTILVIGDTDNDRLMSEHLRAVSGLPVYACIGADQLAHDSALTWEGDTAMATRWELLDSWLHALLERQGTTLADAPWGRTALLLDIDKTLLGPRGRGDAAINESRADAAFLVASDLFGDALDSGLFRATYDTLCQREFHPLTLDNQDYAVYLVLLLLGEVLTIADVRQGMQDGSLETFGHLLAAVEHRLPPVLTTLHHTIQAAHESGDPTPFKAFRHAEFLATVQRMQDGRLRLCRDVVALAQQLVARGAICMAASDKPDEASLPSEAQAAAGFLPLHQTPTLLDGGTVMQR